MKDMKELKKKLHGLHALHGDISHFVMSARAWVLPGSPFSFYCGHSI
jgi:hypothetical protein